MKKIETIISPRLLSEVTDMLARHGAMTVTVADVLRLDGKHRRQARYRGTSYEIPFVDEMKIDIVIDETRAAGLVQALRAITASDTLGVGKVWISSIDDTNVLRLAPRRDVAV